MKKPLDDKKLIKEITLILVIKVFLLFVIWHSFFDGEAQQNTQEIVADKIFSKNIEQGEIF